MKIKELSELVSVSEHTLRYYEKIGLLVPNRLENNYRTYQDNDEFLMKMIVVLQYAQYDLESIKQLIEMFDKTPSEECNRLAGELINGKILELQNKIHQYQMIIQLLKDIPHAPSVDTFREQKHEIIEQMTTMVDSVFYSIKNKETRNNK